MARLFRDGEWYDLISPGSIYESEFQAMVVGQAARLFPEYVTARFDCLVDSEYGTVKADLALVDREYRFWWVVEIELATHNLDDHVFPQVRKLSQGAYGADHARYLASQARTLDLERTEQMMKGSQPRVLVVVNGARPDWAAPLRPLNALVGIVEVYRSATNRAIFRLNGAYPELPHGVVTRCRPEAMMPKFLRVDSPGNLPKTGVPRIKIRFQGAQTTWQRSESGDTVWLIPDGPLALNPRQAYLLERGEDGELDLIEEK